MASITQILDEYRKAKGLGGSSFIDPREAMSWYSDRNIAEPLPSTQTQQAIKGLALPGNGALEAVAQSSASPVRAINENRPYSTLNTRELAGGDLSFPLLTQGNLSEAPGPREYWNQKSWDDPNFQSGRKDQLEQLKARYKAASPEARPAIATQGQALKAAIQGQVDENVERLALGERYTGLSPRYKYTPEEIAGGAGKELYRMGGPAISKALGMKASEVMALDPPSADLLSRADHPSRKDLAYRDMPFVKAALDTDPMLVPKNREYIAQLSLNRRKDRPLTQMDVMVNKTNQGINYGSEYGQALDDVYGDIVRASASADNRDIRDLGTDWRGIGLIRGGAEPVSTIAQTRATYDPFEGTRYSDIETPVGRTSPFIEGVQQNSFNQTMRDLNPSSRMDASDYSVMQKLDIKRPEFQGNFEGNIYDHPDRYRSGTNYTDLYSQPRGVFKDDSPRIMGAFEPEYRPQAVIPGLGGGLKLANPLAGGEALSPLRTGINIQEIPLPGSGGIYGKSLEGGIKPYLEGEKTLLQNLVEEPKAQLNALRDAYRGASIEDRPKIAQEGVALKSNLLDSIENLRIQRDPNPLARVTEQVNLGPMNLSTPQTIVFNQSAPVSAGRLKPEFRNAEMATFNAAKGDYDNALDILKSQYDFSVGPVRDLGGNIEAIHGNTLEGPALVGDKDTVKLGQGIMSDSLDEMISSARNLSDLDTRDRSGLQLADPVAAKGSRLSDLVAFDNLAEQQNRLKAMTGKGFTPTEDLINSPAAQALREKAGARQVLMDVMNEDRADNAYRAANEKMFEIEQRKAQESQALREARMKSAKAQEMARMQSGIRPGGGDDLKLRAAALLERLGKKHLAV
jgi:hypothetical protein